MTSSPAIAPAEQPPVSSVPGSRIPISPITLHVLRFGARLDLPSINRVLTRAGVWDQPRWANAPAREVRGLWHRCRMRLDLADYHQRGAYFYGRLLDLAVQAFIMRALRPGDDCIDLGANIGLLTMAAARAVGPRGRVLAVEPNPDVFKRLQWHIDANRLAWVTPVCVAASDRETTMTLSVPPTGNTGAGSLGRLLPQHGDRTSATYTVPLRRGDDLVAEAWGARGAPRPREPFLLLKLDVEGHETAAIRGLAGTIQRRRPAILTEINAYMLSTNGSSADELFGLLESWRYRPFSITARRRGLRRQPGITLTPLPASWRPDRTVNVLFMSGTNQTPGPINAMVRL